MCRNITELRGLEPAAMTEEVEAAARQYVRKVSGLTRRSSANAEAFEAAVAEVAATTARLLDVLPPRRQPPKTDPPFPTVAHSHSEWVRPEFRDLLHAAAPDSTDDRLIIRAAAKVIAALQVNRPENIGAIEDLHIWTAESVRHDRLDFRPRHRLAVLVVQAIPLLAPIELPRTPDYAGCTSWVPLPLIDPPLGTPVHDEAALHEVAASVREAVV